MREIDKQLIINQIRRTNPWWEKPHKVQQFYLDMKPRPYIESFYSRASETRIRRAIVLMGTRRVGKSCMLHHTIDRLMKDGIQPKKIMYVSLEHSIFTKISIDTILDYYSEITGIDYTKEKCFVIFDEIQYVKDWERYIKPLVDTFPNLKIIVSGSAAAALKRKSMESGAGRFTDFLLPPLTFFEFLFLQDKLYKMKDAPHYFLKADISENKEFVDYINYGGFPEAVFNQSIREDISGSLGDDIIGKVLQKDLPNLYGISDTRELNYLFQTLAYNSGNEISLDDISNKSDISKTTINKYIEYLEAAFLIKIIDRIDMNARRFTRRNRFKVYLTNPSMWTALFGSIKQSDSAFGSLVETAIFAQYFHEPRQRLHYAREKSGKWEIDLVVLKPDLSVGSATEIKWSDKISKRQLDNIVGFCHKHNLNVAKVTTKSLNKVETHQSVNIVFSQSASTAFNIGMIILGYKVEEKLVS